MPRNANQSKFSNYSMDFDGSQSVDVGTVTINNSGSFSIWFKISNIAYYQNILGSSNASGMFKYITLRNGILYQYVLGTGWIVLYSTSLDDNEWHNLVFTYDSTTSGGPARGTFKSYVDGVLTKTHDMINDVSEDWSSSTLASIAYFGTTQPLGARYFDGQITEVSIFDYALSASQATTLWGGGTSVSNPMALPSPPIAYYPLGTSAYNGEYLAENNTIGDYVFDFNNDYVTLNSSINLTGNKTVSYWVNPDSLSGNVYIGGVSPNYYTYMTSTLLYIKDSTGFSTFSINISTGNWYHICITGDGTNATLYINGDSISTTNDRNPTIDTIGAYNGGGGAIDSKMSNVQIFDSVLSSTEVQTLYNYGSPIRTLANIPQSSNLKAWYKLDASEVYNSTTTEWSVDNNQNPSAYASSLDFDSASSDYISLPTITLTDNWSVSVWMNKIGFANRSQAVGTSTGTGFWAYGGDIRSGGSTAGKLVYYNGASLVVLSNERLDDGNWHNWIISYDHSTTTLKCYIDGQENYSDTYNAGTGNTINRISNTFASNYWLGQLSNISIWNTDLTSAQVTEIYNNGTPSNLSSHSATSNLVSWWKLNNTTTGIEDAKGSNDGTNNGATEYTGFVNKLIGDSSGMTQANLVQSDLQTVAPYSKYALDFDAASVDSITINADLSSYSSITVSTWAKFVSATGFQYVFDAGTWTGTGPAGIKLGISKKQTTNEIATYDGLTNHSTGVNVALNTWYHITVTHAGTTRKVYLNGSLIGTFVSGNLNLNAINYIGRFSLNSNFMDGSISNVSIWNTDLTSAQITEIYNQGLPGNLNSHSAYSNLVSWWQLGENSSFDGNDWIVADEKGTNNGTSTGMPVGALVNGVGTTANGVSSGMSEGNLVGDAPYSTANAISTNMVVTSRVSGSGNTP